MQTIADVLAQRETTYGSFAEHARISQTLKFDLTQSINWNTMRPDQREALEMIVHKIARILNGNPDYVDSWTDIAGYATLVEQRLLSAQKELFTPANT